MKLLHQLPILTATMLSVVGTMQAQTQVTPLPPSAPATSPVFPPESLSEMMNYLNLGPGTMGSAVKALEERYFDKYTKDGEDRNFFPKFIYGPGAEDAPIDGELKLSLYDRRALDAVALVAAAAGCRLEPIPALPDAEEDKKKPQRVIGYYVSIAMRNPTVQAPGTRSVFMDLPAGAVAGTIGLTLGEQNGDILIRDVLPGLPAARSKAIVPGEKLLSIAEDGATEVQAAEVGPERVSELLVGQPGSKVRVTVAPPHDAGQPKVVLLTRQPVPPVMTTPPPPLVKVVEPVVDTFLYTNREIPPGAAVPGTPSGTPPVSGNITDPAMATTPVMPGAPAGLLVRIYPVAFLLKGDEKQAAEKQVAMEELILQSLEQASLGGQKPTLSLHRATKVLIVKATPAQHELVQQIIASLKENEQAEAQGTGTLPR